MDKDTYDLIDTAIKIGLGAAIAGISAYFLSLRNLNNDLLKRRIEDKHSLIKDLAFKLEEIESYSNESALHFHNNDIAKAKIAMLPVSQGAYSSRAIANLIGSDELTKDLEDICYLTERMYVELNQDEPKLDKLNDLGDELMNKKKSTYPHIRKAYQELIA
jgi:hypothetical protein